ncbi:ATP-binding protein [Aliiglaciecola lipolytica]|uniref:ATP-binding protein n=1 Tax=Aliiglaciecola lipolytica TaxID=477689 RepID=UPI001C09B809|nr:HAMP domain-containing sensor histidine kinase [Aliiglaciecola lipolytica]MBU2879819.1 HAMP domain-containing histidine kinase [Aliiglaciecola lipolytica]
MKSIRKTLTRRLSFFISLIVLIVLLAADITVDTWISDEFERSMINKAGMLMTFVREDHDGLEFEFAGEFLPEFEGTTESEYFQIWHGEDIFERSDTLTMHTIRSLAYKSIPVDSILSEDIKLPDGRSGRVIYSRFIPQIDSEYRSELLNNKQADENFQKPVLLAYAASVENLNFYLWFIDLAFIIAVITIPLLIRLTVRRVVSSALKPIDELNKEIKAIRFSEQNQCSRIKDTASELVPIVESLNHFINENYSLFLREKRLTSDIAHELKTPVTELINLAEIAIRFPEEYNLNSEFKPEVLKISERMKSIISNLMLIHKYSVQTLQCTDEIDPLSLVQQLSTKLNQKRIQIISADHSHSILTNAFALESILTNLLTNALQHSVENSTVTVAIKHANKDPLVIDISNICINHLNNEELAGMFEPLWQKDTARTSTENFGLGLTIAKTLANGIGAELTVTGDMQHITFQLILNQQSTN